MNDCKCKSGWLEEKIQPYRNRRLNSKDACDISNMINWSQCDCFRTECETIMQKAGWINTHTYYSSYYSQYDDTYLEKPKDTTANSVVDWFWNFVKDPNSLTIDEANLTSGWVVEDDSDEYQKIMKIVDTFYNELEYENDIRWEYEKEEREIEQQKWEKYLDRLDELKENGYRRL